MNLIPDFIAAFEKKYMIHFKPRREFYQRTGIGQKRWNKLLSKNENPKSEELVNLCQVFDCEVSELFDFTKK